VNVFTEDLFINLQQMRLYDLHFLQLVTILVRKPHIFNSSHWNTKVILIQEAEAKRIKKIVAL